MPDLVRITDKMLRQAREYQKKIELSKTVRRRANYTTVQVAERYFIGYLGELVLADVLESYQIKFTHQINTKGKPVDHKFRLSMPHDSGYITMNPVTASDKRHNFMVVPRDKFARDTCQAYAAIKLILDEGFAEVFGYFWRHQLPGRGLSEIKYGVQVYALPLYMAEPIFSMTELTQRSAT